MTAMSDRSVQAEDMSADAAVCADVGFDDSGRPAMGPSASRTHTWELGSLNNILNEISCITAAELQPLSAGRSPDRGITREGCEMSIHDKVELPSEVLAAVVEYERNIQQRNQLTVGELMAAIDSTADVDRGIAEQRLLAIAEIGKELLCRTICHEAMTPALLDEAREVMGGIVDEVLSEWERATSIAAGAAISRSDSHG